MRQPTAPARYSGPPPPPGGAAAAIHSARARHRRRVIVAATGATAATVAAAAIASAVASRHTAIDDPDRLRFGRLGPVPQVTVTTAPQPTSSAIAVQDADVPAPSSVDPDVLAQTPPVADAAEARGTATRPTSAGPPGRHDGVDAPMSSTPITRSYVPRTMLGPALCTGAGSGAVSSTKLGWCVSASAVPSEEGHRLEIRVCRDETGGAQLTFPSAAEADFEVYASGRMVWSWSEEHGMPRGGGSVLPLPHGSCYVWRTTWSHADGEGGALPAGDYELHAMTFARELDGAGRTGTHFTIK